MLAGDGPSGIDCGVPLIENTRRALCLLWSPGELGPCPARACPGTSVRKLDSPKNNVPGPAGSADGEGLLAAILVSEVPLSLWGLAPEQTSTTDDA